MDFPFLSDRECIKVDSDSSATGVRCMGYIYIYLPTSPHKQDVTQGQFLKRSLRGLNSELSFS